MSKAKKELTAESAMVLLTETVAESSLDGSDLIAFYDELIDLVIEERDNLEAENEEGGSED